MRLIYILFTFLILPGAAQAMGSDSKVPTLEERKKAVDAQIKISQEMATKPIDEQLKIAQEWAKTHRTAMAAGSASTEIAQAYAFRSYLNGDPQCQVYAQQADNVFLETQSNDAAKATALSQIGNQARAAGCVNMP